MTPPALPPSSRLHGLSQDAIGQVIAAAQALDGGAVNEAARHSDALLVAYPAHPEVLRLAAGVYNLRGQYDRAIAALRRAIALRPNDALYYNTLGSTLSSAGDYDAAIGALRHACELDPELAIAWFNLGLASMRSMRVDDAAAALRRAVELSPDQPTARVMLGDMLRAQGRNDEAVAEYRAVLAGHADAGMAWWALADIRTVEFADVDVRAMQRVLESRAGIDDRIATGFALARAFEQRERFAASLDALAAANALARERQTWNATAHSVLVDGVLGAFTPTTTAAASAPQGDEVIFVASMPRSGSTLVEQILATHSQVEGAGELPDLPMVLTEESRRRGVAFPQWVAAMDREDWARLGRRYLERTAHWRERRPRFTDKLPYNWLYAGAIRAMLPGARIVIARRDPLETCLACYRQRLAGNEYTRTFVDLGAFWRDFDRAARRWHALYPEHVRENRHEVLVEHPDREIRALLAFCGLPFEAACLDFHATDRAVHTPSASQVREPLRDSARAPRYGALLDPLRAALGLPAFTMSARS